MSDPILRPWTPADRQWLTGLHARLYREEAGFDDSFATAVDAVQEGYAGRASPREMALVVEEAGEGRGSIFCTRLDAQTGQVRLFLLAPHLRGTGLAGRMLESVTVFARQTGCSRMKLWTHESHEAACRLYRRCGWIPEDSRSVRNYGQDLVELTWIRSL